MVVVINVAIVIAKVMVESTHCWREILAPEAQVPLAHQMGRVARIPENFGHKTFSLRKAPRLIGDNHKVLHA